VKSDDAAPDTPHSKIESTTALPLSSSQAFQLSSKSTRRSNCHHHSQRGFAIDSCMTPIDMEGPFSNAPFDDALDVDVWNETDSIEGAVGPAGKVYTTALAADSNDGMWSRPLFQNRLPQSKGHDSQGDNHEEHKKQPSRRRESRRPKLESTDEPLGGSNHCSGRSRRSQRSNNSSEVVVDARNVAKTIDRRTRPGLRTSSGVSKQPQSRRSLAGKEKSLRSLVSLLNSSTDCLEIDYDEDEAAEATSKGYSNHDSLASLSEESEDEGVTEPRSFRNENPSNRNDQENLSIGSGEITNMGPSDRPRSRRSSRGVTFMSSGSKTTLQDSGHTDSSGKEASAQTNRSQRSNNSSETVDDTRNGVKTLDRRTRLGRTSNVATKQPQSRRSLAGKEKSLRNLVSLLNSSADCLEIDYDEDEAAEATVASMGVATTIVS